jgi:chromosome segregation ATPase
LKKGKIMSQAKRFLGFGILLLACLSFTSFSRSQANTNSVNQSQQADNGQTMQALLSEVRQLRLAIQRSNLNAYHAQVTFERVRMQQQRVDRLNEKLSEVREQIAKIKMEQTQLPEQARAAEGRLSQETDPARRRSLEDMQKGLKYEIERLSQMEAHGRETESQLNGQLQIEQAKLSELNDSLDALQKELEIEGKPQQPGVKRQ